MYPHRTHRSLAVSLMFMTRDSVCVREGGASRSRLDDSTTTRERKTVSQPVPWQTYISAGNAQQSVRIRITLRSGSRAKGTVSIQNNGYIHQEKQSYGEQDRPTVRSPSTSPSLQCSHRFLQPLVDHTLLLDPMFLPRPLVQLCNSTVNLFAMLPRL